MFKDDNVIYPEEIEHLIATIDKDFVKYRGVISLHDHALWGREIGLRENRELFVNNIKVKQSSAAMKGLQDAFENNKVDFTDKSTQTECNYYIKIFVVALHHLIEHSRAYTQEILGMFITLGQLLSKRMKVENEGGLMLATVIMYVDQFLLNPMNIDVLARRYNIPRAWLRNMTLTIIKMQVLPVDEFSVSFVFVVKYRLALQDKWLMILNDTNDPRETMAKKIYPFIDYSNSQIMRWVLYKNESQIQFARVWLKCIFSSKCTRERSSDHVSGVVEKYIKALCSNGNVSEKTLRNSHVIDWNTISSFNNYVGHERRFLEYVAKGNRSCAFAANNYYREYEKQLRDISKEDLRKYAQLCARYGLIHGIVEYYEKYDVFVSIDAAKRVAGWYKNLEKKRIAAMKTNKVKTTGGRYHHSAVKHIIKNTTISIPQEKSGRMAGMNLFERGIVIAANAYDTNGNYRGVNLYSLIDKIRQWFYQFSAYKPLDKLKLPKMEFVKTRRRGGKRHAAAIARATRGRAAFAVVHPKMLAAYMSSQYDMMVHYDDAYWAHLAETQPPDFFQSMMAYLTLTMRTIDASHYMNAETSKTSF